MLRVPGRDAPIHESRADSVTGENTQAEMYAGGDRICRSATQKPSAPLVAPRQAIERPHAQRTAQDAGNQEHNQQLNAGVTQPNHRRFSASLSGPSSFRAAVDHSPATALVFKPYFSRLRPIPQPGHMRKTKENIWIPQPGKNAAGKTYRHPGTAKTQEPITGRRRTQARSRDRNSPNEHLLSRWRFFRAMPVKSPAAFRFVDTA